MKIDLNKKTGAELFLEILQNFGVDFIFAASGTEWTPLWEALAKKKAGNQPVPKYLCVRHEDVAIGMASGYSRLTGKLSVCLVHSVVGAMRIAMGVRGAHQAHIPMLVCAGESLTYGEGTPWVGFYWGRFLGDYGGPASLMEPVVKSSFRVSAPILLPASVHRACNMAVSASPGPVFLGLPLEILAAPAEGRMPTAYDAPRPAVVDASALAQVGEILKHSKKPLIVTEKIGRKPSSVADLVKVAEAVGAVVVEAQRAEYVNFPRQHDLHGGFNAGPYLQDCDVVLLLDMVGPPWHPETIQRPNAAKIIAIGEDPLRSRAPYSSTDADLVLVGAPADAVARLAALLPAPTENAKSRRAEMSKRSSETREHWHSKAREHKTSEPIDSRWMCEVLNDVLPEDAILVDETIVQNITIIRVMDKLKPGQYVNANDGGLGTGLAAALGVKVAAPDRPVVAIIGDGAFTYNAPLAILAACQEFDLPITIVIGNNGYYLASKNAIQHVYPEGFAVRSDTFFGSVLAPSINYAEMAGLVGGYGEMVTSPARIKGAMAAALQANKDGKPAIINVLIGDESEYLGAMMKKASH